VSEEVFVAIQKFDQRALDVMIPLVPGFEREGFKAPLRFPLCHMRADNSVGAFEREVLRAAESRSLWKNPPICG